MINKLKTDWSFDLPVNGTQEQHQAIKNTLVALGYKWTLCTNTKVDWGRYQMVWHDHEDFGGQGYLCVKQPNHFSSFLNFLAWHFQEEETEEQKEIKDIRQQMDKLSQRLKQLEG